MTILFWLMAAAMMLVAVAVIWIPLSRRGAKRAATETTALALHRERLAELEADLASGAVDPAAYAVAREEIARQALIDERQAAAPVAEERGRGGRWSRGVVLVLLPVAALGLYAVNGQGLNGGLGLQSAEQLDPAQMVAQLEARLAEQPGDGRGWQMLARSYFVLERHAEAVSAYQRAQGLLGNDPDLLADYAEAVTMARQGNMSGLPSELLALALEQDAQHPKALWLDGLAGLQAGDVARTRARWTLLQAHFPEGSEPRRLLTEQLAQLDTADGDSPSAAAVTVQVRLGPGLVDRVQPSDTVFIFARTADGAAMPLAAVRHIAGDLPFTVQLDAGDAVMPGQRLSAGQSVIVVARISRDGDVRPQPGDLEGRTAVIEPGEAVHELVIDGVVDGTPS